MQPQDSNTPAQTPVPGIQQSNAGKKKKRIIIAVAAIVGVALLALIAMTVIKAMASIKLTTFSNKQYTLQVPADYEKEENGDSVNFSEKEPEKTRSEVMVYYADFPTAVTEDQVKTIEETLRTQLRGAANELADDKNKKVENLKVAGATFKGKDALQLTANVSENGKIVGDVKLIAVVNTKQIYMVGVAAHESDPGLKKKINAVIDSFTLKD